MASPAPAIAIAGHNRPRPEYRMTYATEAFLIIREEDISRAAARIAEMSDDLLRQAVQVGFAKEAKCWTDDGLDPPDYLPKPATMSREELVQYLAEEAGWDPPTEALPVDDDDPLVLTAQKLRLEEWEQRVTAAIGAQGLAGEAAARERAKAEEAERAYLRRFIEETWALPEAQLRARAVEIVKTLAGGDEGDKKFRHDPAKLSRGALLAAIADHLNWLMWSPELRRESAMP